MALSQKFSKNFFILSLLPALAYWYLDEHYPVRVALLGGLLLALLELLVEKIFTRHLHPFSLFNFSLIALLGIVSLILDSGVFFKLQPLFTGVGMGGYLLYMDYRGTPFLWDMMKSMNRPLPPQVLWKSLERHLAVFFILFGLFMGATALWGNNDHWIFFKSIGFYLVFFGFMLFEVVLMRIKIKKFISKNGLNPGPPGNTLSRKGSND